MVHRLSFIVHRFVLPIVSGFLFAWAFPNVAIGWLIFLAPLPLFIAIVHARGGFEAAVIGWLSQTTAWLLMVPWVVRVMSHYGGLPYLTGVAIFIAMCCLLGLYGAAFGWIAWRCIGSSLPLGGPSARAREEGPQRREASDDEPNEPSLGKRVGGQPREFSARQTSGPSASESVETVAEGRVSGAFSRWLLLPLAWAAIEYARTYLLTGFPWNLVAAAIVDYTPLIQIDRFAGPYAMPMLIFLPATLASWWIVTRPKHFHAGIVTGGVAIICFVWWITGYTASKFIGRPDAETSTAALLQPDISQEMRWNDSNLMEIFGRMMAMTSEATTRGVNLVIWPESTVPLSYSTTDFYRRSIEAASLERGTDIILGSVAEDPHQPSKMWNAAFLVSNGRTIGHYDKIRLVPFGEYVPLRKMLFFAHKLVRAVGEFEFGTKDTPLSGKLRYGLAICYEIVFPQIARQQVLHGADVLVTITNDAWYDGTSAPRQHLNQARLRAIETNRYLLRAATTGISAFVDPTGRIVEQLPMNRQGIIYAKFGTRHSVTPYVRFGDWFAWVACVVVLIGILPRGGRRAEG